MAKKNEVPGGVASPQLPAFCPTSPALAQVCHPAAQRSVELHPAPSGLGLSSPETRPQAGVTIAGVPNAGDRPSAGAGGDVRVARGVEKALTRAITTARADASAVLADFAQGTGGPVTADAPADQAAVADIAANRTACPAIERISTQVNASDRRAERVANRAAQWELARVAGRRDRAAVPRWRLVHRGGPPPSPAPRIGATTPPPGSSAGPEVDWAEEARRRGRTICRRLAANTTIRTRRRFMVPPSPIQSCEISRVTTSEGFPP